MAKATAKTTATANKRQVFAWACYDWANSAFATTIIAGMFPIFFKDFWSAGQAGTNSTFWLGLSNSAASLAIALLAPILGAMADSGTGKKRFLAIFTFIGVFTTGGLYLIDKGEWQLACLTYVIARIGFQGSMVFYDALLMDVSTKGNRERVSAFGFAFGYLGGGIQFLLCVAMVTRPDIFGLVSSEVSHTSQAFTAAKAHAVQLSFIFTALWWALWSLPTFFGVTESKRVRSNTDISPVKQAFTQLRITLSSIRQYQHIVLFLFAYWLYIDGVHTVVTMAVDFGKNLKMESDQLIMALLLTQFVGFPATLFFGYVGHRVGAKPMILFAIGVYIITVVLSTQLTDINEFFIMAGVIGLVQGTVQAMSRSLYASMIPQGKEAEFFGFYNMLGKFASVLGPLLVGMVTVLSGNPKLGLLSVAVLLVAGGLVLTKVQIDVDR